MKISRRSFVGAALVSAALPATRLCAQLQARDIKVLRHAYTALHPGLYRYATPAQVEARFDALDAEFQQIDDLAGQYLALSRFCGTVRCGHSYANFYNQTRAVQERLFGDRNRLPFTFRWIDSRMVVLDEGVLPRGTEVLRVDGRRTSDILKALLPLARGTAVTMRSDARCSASRAETSGKASTSTIRSCFARATGSASTCGCRTGAAEP